MNPTAIDATTAVVGTAGIAGLFLPGIEKAWNANPADSDTRNCVRFGGKVYLLIVVLVGMLQSAKAKSVVPLIVGAGLAAAILYTYETALRSYPKGA